MNINSNGGGGFDFNVGLPSLSPPDTENQQTGSVTSRENVPVQRDTQTTGTSSAGTASLTTINNLRGGDPVPPPPRPYQGIENPVVAGRGGSGNPYFSANPMVAFVMAFQEMYAAMRDSQLIMAEYERESGMKGVLALAQTSANLTMLEAEATAQQHRTQGIVAIAAMAVSIAQLGMSFASEGVAKNAHKKEVSKNKAELADLTQAKTKATTDLKAQQDAMKNMEADTGLDSLRADQTAQKTKLDQLKNERAQLQKDLQKDTVSTDRKLDKQARLDQLNQEIPQKEAVLKDVEDRISLKEQDQSFIDQKKKLTEAEDLKADLDKKHKDMTDYLAHLDSPAGERNWINNKVQHEYMPIITSGCTALNKAIEAVGKFMEADIEIRKGKLKADKEMVEAYKQIQTRAADAVAKSMETTRSNMGQLLQTMHQVTEAYLKKGSLFQG